MIEKVENKDLEKLRNLFKDIRFYMGNSVLDGTMGEAYTDNISNPNFAILIVRKYCFMSGNIGKEDLHKLIDNNIAKKIKEEKFINITDNYEKNGIGYCCIYNDEIIGVASSNIFYKDGIEVNIKVKDEYRRRGIATALASKLILKCLEENKSISWDAANLWSVSLAEKLGFEYDSTYNIYALI